ncbi:4'-phosphopantetheinyl transferase family protein [Sinosporangium siamense]|uniref:4'-phosphopantetheinyl transferase n=1 Tax=Sinosporangium siamense TaxID=1367973 RepID=A0A919RBN1_9ACTN|nr:4'-phosphopantetheinyl transferase superfamily protein [Sinosporangium siamense]GII90698.1 4'-phosphopantetheinyl transferase [Sinosporangium siamense]
MIRHLLPAGVEVEEVAGRELDVELFPVEEAVVVQGGIRRREFTTTRSCARTALARLGVPPSPIVPGEGGAPQWPDGVVGSITHCAGYRAVAVARAADVAAIGLDVVPGGDMPTHMLEAIALPREQVHVSRLAEARPEIGWGKLLFSAKESVYKACYPLNRRRMGYRDVAIVPDLHSGAFTARLTVPGPVVGGRQVTGFAGRWSVTGGLVMTAVAQPLFQTDEASSPRA